jgi:hypothetical protein
MMPGHEAPTPGDRNARSPGGDEGALARDNATWTEQWSFGGGWGFTIGSVRRWYVAAAGEERLGRFVKGLVIALVTTARRATSSAVVTHVLSYPIRWPHYGSDDAPAASPHRHSLPPSEHLLQSRVGRYHLPNSLHPLTRGVTVIINANSSTDTTPAATSTGSATWPLRRHCPCLLS